jgi:hypothetical protein
VAKNIPIIIPGTRLPSRMDKVLRVKIAKSSTGKNANAERNPAWNIGFIPAFTTSTITWLSPSRAEKNN